jgi:TRAP-type C4-dicarboxylate transport system permease small subunit
VLGKLEAAALVLAQALSAFGLLLLLAYATMTLADGLSRAFWDTAIEAVRDLDSVVVAVAVACCFPIAFLQRGNITIKFAVLVVGHRVAAALDAGASVLVGIAMVLIAHQLFVYAGQEARAGDSTVMLEIRVAPFWYVVGFAVACATAVQAIVAARDIARCLTVTVPQSIRSR